MVIDMKTPCERRITSRRHGLPAASTWILATIAGALSWGAASAFVLPAGSEAQRVRADIDIQQRRYTACLVRASIRCEESSTSVGRDCVLATGAVANGADRKGRFVRDIATCDRKLNYLKRVTTDAISAYSAIGCPGDADPATPGDQPYPDMNAYQEGATTKGNADTLILVLGALNAAICHSGVPATDSRCAGGIARRLGNYVTAELRCITACENDYSNRSGNGGTTDARNCQLDSITANDGTNGNDLNSTADPLFNSCMDTAFAKAVRQEPFPGLVGSLLLGQINAVLNRTTDQPYNDPDDCTQ